METATEEPDRLESWKQIAAYLNRSERTVRRWHELEGLPVHKHQHRQRGSVWAYRTELDQWLAARVIRPEAEPEPLPSPQPRRKWPLLTVIGAAAAALIVIQMARPKDRVEVPARETPLTALPGAEYGASFSSDRRMFVFHWSRGSEDPSGIYLKEIDKERAPSPLVVSDGSPSAMIYSPAWSPDGSTVAFLERTASEGTWLCTVNPKTPGSRRRLKQIAVAPTLYFANHQHVSWSADSQSVVVPVSLKTERGIYRVSVKTGDSANIIDSDRVLAPAVSRDGSRLAWIRRQGLPIASEEILLTRLASDGSAMGDPTLLYKGETISAGIAWAPDGESLYFCNLESSLLGAFPTRLFKLPAVSGATPTAIGGVGCSTVSVTHDDAVVFGKSSNPRAIMMRFAPQEQGAPQPFASSSRYDSHPSFSSDGRRVAFHSNRSGQPEIWIAQSDGSGLRRLTSNSMVHTTASWSPSDAEIVYGAGRSIVIHSLAGDKISRIEVPGSVVQDPLWSIDGQRIYYKAGTQLWRMDRDGSHREMIRDLPETLQMSESFTGKHIYFSRAGQRFMIGRVPIDGGPEEIVEDGLAFPWFAVTKNSIYAVRSDMALHAIPLNGGEPIRVQNLPVFGFRGHEVWSMRLAVSPDGSTIMWTRADAQEIDLEILKAAP
jgi:Tol biopolymer transport system component